MTALFEVEPSFAPRKAHEPPPGDTPSWFTDVEWFLALERRLIAEKRIPHQFNMDPFGNDEAPVSRLIRARGGVVLCGSGAPEDDGLLVSRRGLVSFENPPYDAPTMGRFVSTIERSRATAQGLVLLIPAWTDRGWWHDGIEPHRKAGRAEVEFIRGRLHFGWPGNPEHLEGDGAKFPSAVVVFRR